MDYDSSDLTSVLKTLSSLTKPPLNQHDNSNNNNDDYEPSEIVSPPSLGTTTSTSSSPINPSSITTWPTALKYVMQMAACNEALQHRIRRLIQSQHDHERQWWRGREALLKKQEGRAERKGELDRVLYVQSLILCCLVLQNLLTCEYDKTRKSVGVPVDSNKYVLTEEELQAERKVYDEKVYMASVQMAEAMDRELRALGIPFFAIRPNLVQYDDNELTREALAALQRRMLDLLQDLCCEGN